VPASWIGWTSLGVALLATAGIFARRFTGGFRGIFVGWVIGGVVALVAIAWKKERSILAWLVLVVGALAAIWGSAEVLFPH